MTFSPFFFEEEEEGVDLPLVEDVLGFEEVGGVEVFFCWIVRFAGRADGQAVPARCICSATAR